MWQDVDAAHETRASWRPASWLGAGGQLVIVGGTTGTTTLTAFPPRPAERPARAPMDVPAADLVPLVGALPTTATAVPAVEGLLRRGTMLARSGDEVVAAQAYGGARHGEPLGFNPAVAWLRASSTPNPRHRLLPIDVGPVLNPLTLPDDCQIIRDCAQPLPSVDLPPIDQLFVPLVAYIALMGPINYLILRRLDKREWWVTIPVVVVSFAIAAYTLGAASRAAT